MKLETYSSSLSSRSTRFDSMEARLLAALALLGCGYLLLIGYIVGAASLPARGALLIGASLIAALIAALLLSLWAAARSTSQLIARLERGGDDPDLLVRMMHDTPASTAECRRLMASFADVITQLQTSRRELRLSEERFALAMQATNDGIWDWHFDNNAIYFSPRWKQMLGYEDHELPNLFPEWETRVHPDDLVRARTAIDEHLTGRTCCFELEHRLLHKSGSYRWVLSRGIAVRDESGKPYRLVGSHADITERKQTEARLRENEARFRTMFEQSPFGIQIFNPQGKTTHANHAYLTLWSLTGLEQLDGFNVLTDSQLDAAGLLPYIHQGFAGQATAIPAMRYDPSLTPSISSGRSRWVESVIYPIKDAAGAIREVVLIFVDITERKEAEEAMRASEARFRSMFEGAAIGMALINRQGLGVENNAAFRQMLGYSAEELQAGSSVLITHPDDLHIDGDLYGELQRGERTSYQIEKRYIRKDGSIFWGRRSISLIRNGVDDNEYALVMVENIDEQKRVAEQLREREEQYRSIFEATSDGLIINDLDTGLIVEVNPAVCAMHGYTYDELIGQHPSLIIDPSQHHIFHEYLATIQQGGAYQTQSIDVRRDGTPLHVEVHGSSFTYKGRPHILGVIRDITERVQAYELLEQRVAERTRELSTLLDVSHNVASTLELKPLLALILDQLQAVVDYSGATIYLAEGDQLMLLGYRDPLPEDAEVEDRIAMSRMGIIWDQLRAGECVIIDDTTSDTPLGHAYQAIVGEDLHTLLSYIRSWIGVPLILKERVIGMLSLKHDVPHHFTEQHVRLALAVANQAAVAIENARLFEQAQGLAALMERQRLARELHDSVSQALYGIALGARTARTLLDRDPSRLAEPLDYVLALAEAGLTEMRALIFALRPESLELEGLAAALSKQAASVRARHGIDVDVQLCDEPELTIERKEALYRIAQEALHNIVKHAQASRVELTLALSDGALVLSVRDNGQGFDTTQRFPGHLGLRSMRERVTKLGGTLTIESAPGQGTLVRAKMPC
ncbi:MAG TPA: PAS domain S-box protein [Herpetosiphonaceae bacterium]